MSPERQALADGGELVLYPSFLAADEAARALAELLAALPLRAERVFVHGRWYDQPRRVSWHAEPGCSYRYSALTLEPDPWCEPLRAQRARLLALLGRDFDSVLANHYRDGRDCVGWHADDEPCFGVDPVIASVSLGAARRFCLKHKQTGERRELLLPGGSLLVMAGTTQRFWLHSLPRTRRPVGERLNLTWRQYLRAPAQRASDHHL